LVRGVQCVEDDEAVPIGKTQTSCCSRYAVDGICKVGTEPGSEWDVSYSMGLQLFIVYVRTEIYYV
jgi:hypothetical protein